MTKVALIDFDGVILRSTKIHSAVKARAELYVGKALMTQSDVVARKANAYMYNTYGHTLLGLEKVIGKTAAGTLHDFNSFVYEGFDMNRDDFFEAQKDLSDWNKLISKLKSNNIPVHIFSNAPRDWCINFIDPSMVNGFIGDNVPIDSEYLKPESKVFDVVDAWFANKDVYFIDDRIHNLKWSMNKKNWVNILFSNDQPREYVKLQDRLFASKTLSACGDIIC